MSFVFLALSLQFNPLVETEEDSRLEEAPFLIPFMTRSRLLNPPPQVSVFPTASEKGEIRSSLTLGLFPIDHSCKYGSLSKGNEA